MKALLTATETEKVTEDKKGSTTNEEMENVNINGLSIQMACMYYRHFSFDFYVLAFSSLSKTTTIKFKQP